MARAKDTSTREQAKALYLERKLRGETVNEKVLCEIVGVSSRTIERWRVEDNWIEAYEGIERGTLQNLGNSALNNLLDCRRLGIQLQKILLEKAISSANSGKLKIGSVAELKTLMSLLNDVLEQMRTLGDGGPQKPPASGGPVINMLIQGNASVGSQGARSLPVEHSQLAAVLAEAHNRLDSAEVVDVEGGHAG